MSDSEQVAPDPAAMAEARRLAIMFMQEGSAIALSGDHMPRQLYHYTTLAAFMQIMDSNVLWATDCRYLNDTKELSYGVGFIESRIDFAIERLAPNKTEYLKHLRRSFDPLGYGLRVYCTSFSAEIDDINQWRGYSSGTGGICLQMDVRPPACADNGTNLIQVIYDVATQSKIVDDLIDRAVALEESMPQRQEVWSGWADCSMAFREVCLPLALRFKSPHWQSEREWRLIIATDRGSPKLPLKHRIGQMGLIPYIELPLRKRYGGNDHLLPIDKIMVGPHFNSDAIRLSIEEFLDNRVITLRYGMDISTVPLR